VGGVRSGKKYPDLLIILNYRPPINRDEVGDEATARRENLELTWAKNRKSRVEQGPARTNTPEKYRKGSLGGFHGTGRVGRSKENGHPESRLRIRNCPGGGGGGGGVSDGRLTSIKASENRIPEIG